MRSSLVIGLLVLAAAAQAGTAQEFLREPWPGDVQYEFGPALPLEAALAEPQQPASPDNASPVAPAPALVPAETIPETTADAPIKLWEGSFELGLSGTEGNSQTLNLRFGAKVKRKTELSILTADLDYHRDSADSITTANRTFLDWRFERLLGESPWTWFVHGTVDYDEFKEYDLRVSVDTGLGYRFVKNDTTSLTGRLGGGVTDEIGGPDPRFIPEAVFGIEGERKISKRQKLSLSVDYMPDVTDFQDYRLNTKAAWEVLLDEAMHLSMKLGVLDRYDSASGASKPNDLDYSAMLMWSF